MAGPARPIGIVAGSGVLPIDGARAIVARGGQVHIAMVDDLADPSLRSYPHTIVNWAQVGRTMRAFRSAGVQDVIMLGATGRPSFRNARPDWGFIKALPSILRFLNAGGDDAVLRGLVKLFETNGLRIASVAEVVPELLIAQGPLTRARPSARDELDIAKAFAVVRALGQFDIGQGCVVIDEKIAAIEGAEGTDRMLERITRASGNRRGVLVKRPKPSQDMRVDLPTIGLRTAMHAKRAGLAGVAVMADNVLAAERIPMVEYADANGIFIVGMRDSNQSQSNDVRNPTEALKLLSAKSAPDFELDDITKGIRIVLRLAMFAAQASVIIINRRVISIAVGEPLVETLARANRARRSKRTRGIAVTSSALDNASVQALRDCHLTGAVVVGTTAASDVRDDAIEMANKIGVFVGRIAGQEIS